MTGLFINWEIYSVPWVTKLRSTNNRLPPPHTLIMDFTMTHIRFGRSHLHPMRQLTHTRRSDGDPDPDGSLTFAEEVTRSKIRHYRNVYIIATSSRPDPSAFLPLAVDTSVRLYDDFIRLLFLHAHREASTLADELPEESDQFRFLRAVCFANLEGAVGLIMVKASSMRISIPLDLSSRSFIPLPRFIRSRLPSPFLATSLVLFPPRSV